MRNSDYAIACAVMAVIVGCALALVAQPAQARDVEPDWTWKVQPSDRANNRALTQMVKQDELDSRDEHAARMAEKLEAERIAAEEAAAAEAAYWASYCEPVHTSYDVPSDGLTAFTGVNEYSGRTETYYSSNVLYHQDTASWTVDSEGFYRTDEGYYVVAASDMEQGTVFEGSKGECVVLDCGCADGVTDYYTAW